MRTKFKLLVHESIGQKYEDLFIKIMTYADKSFKPVKAHGNIGDFGNDGWCEKEGKYFQVYAPDDLPKNSAKSIKKAKDDLKKLFLYWNSISPIKEYYFVVNDKYSGVSPHLSKIMAELKKKHSLKECDVILSKDIEETLFSLNQDIIEHILGINNSKKNQKNIYGFLVDELEEKMYLKYWPTTSENLISDTIRTKIIDGFSEAKLLIFKTDLPNILPSFETSVKELADQIERLITHFTDSDFTYLTVDHKWWRRDMRWKKTWINQDTYTKKYEQCNNWSIQLYYLHSNLVYALNVYAEEVREHIDSNYLMHQQFTIVDTLGKYNELDGYEAIPNNYKQIN